MRVRVPDYFDGFSCLAGACSHSCCIGWEVVLDEDTVRRYQQLPGALGSGMRWPWTERMSAFRWTAAAVPF